MDRRAIAGLVGVGAIVATLSLNLYTLTEVARARTSVPWTDQWAMVQELAQHERGAPLGPLLWSSYWGHRLVIPRLLFLADERWFSLASLTWLTLLLQLLHVALLIGLAWRLMGRSPPAPFLFAVAVILNLMLSPFQMENFVWSMQTMFALVLLAAAGAFVCLSCRRAWWVALAIALGLISSYTMPNGLLVWPILAAQAIASRMNRRAVLTLVLIGAAVIGTYCWHYAGRPELGMGVAGILRHPIDALLILGLIVGSPLRLSTPVDSAVGLLTLTMTGYLFVRAYRLREASPPWASALFAILLFQFLSSLMLVAGRLSPAVLHIDTLDPIPGKYFTLICAFWASIALLVLYTWRTQGLRVWVTCFYGALFVCLMFVSIPRQLVAASDWADFFRGADAVGSAFVLDIRDEQLLSILGPAPPDRAACVAFLKQRGLGVFHEARATWPGKQVSALFPSTAGRCIGAIEKKVEVDESSWRVTGWAWNLDTASSPDDILFTDSGGRIVGMARGGLRHGYMPGFLIEPGPVPESHARFRYSEWLGYVRQPDSMRLYGLSGGKLCEVTPPPGPGVL